MSQEINASFSLSFAKSGASGGISGTNFPTFAGSVALHDTVLVGTSAVQIHFTAVAVGGLFAAINRDSTNTVTLRQTAAATPELCVLKPGEFCVFRKPNSVSIPYAIASAGPALLEYFEMEP